MTSVTLANGCGRASYDEYAVDMFARSYDVTLIMSDFVAADAAGRHNVGTCVFRAAAVR